MSGIQNVVHSNWDHKINTKSQNEKINRASLGKETCTAVISPFSIAQDWFPGSTVYGPDSSRSSCVAIILPFIFIHHSLTSGSGMGEESMPNSGASSMNPVTRGGLLLLGQGYTTLHRPVEWAVRSQRGSQLGGVLCNWPKLCSKGPNSALKHPDNSMKGRSSPLIKAVVWK